MSPFPQGNRPVLDASTFDPRNPLDVQAANLVLADHIRAAREARAAYIAAMELNDNFEASIKAFGNLCTSQDALVVVLCDLQMVGHVAFTPFANPNETIQ